jgi:hypothetical protein
MLPRTRTLLAATSAAVVAVLAIAVLARPALAAGDCGPYQPTLCKVVTVPVCLIGEPCYDVELPIYGTPNEY